MPYPPMEAQLVGKIPSGPEWQFEPTWDGFRCLVFRDGVEIQLQSKAGQPLGRYFPELLEAVRRIRCDRFVFDSEIVIPVNGRLSFDDLLLRIHPAESRVRKLAAEHPAALIAFDLLVDARGRNLAGLPLKERRRLLVSFVQTCLSGSRSILLSPATADRTEAVRWLKMTGANTDGVIAKRVDFGYRSGDRSGMQKTKRLRTADCVVGGFRYGSGRSGLVGSLLLGLYDSVGALNHVGFTSGLKASEREALTRKLDRLIEPPGFTGRAPGGHSRWSTERSGEWIPLRPDLVVEVQYDHFSGGRFRHGTKLLRWRPDKLPRQCTRDQVEEEYRSGSLDAPLVFE